MKNRHAQYPSLIEIEPLSYTTLQEAETLRDTIFNDLYKREKLLLKASLSPPSYPEVFESNDILTARYWVAKDPESAKVIGLTGIYTEVTDAQEDCWLGWFCIDENYRGLGLGKKLFDLSIEQAQKYKKAYLHIYTSRDKRYETAVSIYKSYGFRAYVVENRNNKHELYFKKKVKDI